MSAKFQSFLNSYKVQHRVSSVGFPHANTRSEIAVKTAKRVLRANTSITGELDNVAVTRAMLQHRNTPDRDIGMSPAQLLYGRQLRDFLPGKPQDYVRLKREKALAKRCSKIKEKLSEHTKDLPPLSLGDTVLVQNQRGNNPRRWEKRGVVVQALPHRQYRVMMDGSRKISLRSRKFLRSYSPLHISDSPARGNLRYNLHNIPDRNMASMGKSTQAASAPPQENQPNVWQQGADHLPVSSLMYPQPEHDYTTDDAHVEEGQEVQAPEQQTPNARTPMQAPQFIHTNEQSQPEPQYMPSPVAPSPAPRRSARRPAQMPMKYGDFYTGEQFDQATTELNFMDNGYQWEGNCPCYQYQWENRYPGQQLESSRRSNPQEEIVGLSHCIPVNGT